MGKIDTATLVIIVLAGGYLGLAGLFGWEIAAEHGSIKAGVFTAIGVAALWQALRQGRG